MGHWTISLRLSVPLELRMVMDWRGVSALFPLPMTSGTTCRIPVCPLVATEFEGECALRLRLEYEIAGEGPGVWWCCVWFWTWWGWIWGWAGTGLGSGEDVDVRGQEWFAGAGADIVDGAGNEQVGAPDVDGWLKWLR
uniref:Uncharacterized protein n=1 Tax=Ixodes ricinus TaxID=34613 RepID=A0A6B0USM1_IXORI